MIESIRCSNCGSIAERHHLSYLAQVKTQCEECDYLLVMCTRSGHVLESYAPGLPSEPPLPIKSISSRRNSFMNPHGDRIAIASKI
jgi:DNA-directed RNA polymerase subunit N (RpoN/RPB10)